MNLETIYNKLPITAQNIACSFYGFKEARIRYSKSFYRYLDWLSETEKWDQTEINAYQDEKLKELIKYAFKYVPYYRNIMKERGLQPVDIQRKEDLYKLPILTKEIVREHKNELLSEIYSKNEFIPLHTSGTTGKSLHFYSTKDALAFQWAIWWRHRRRFGIDLDDWHVNFTGKLVVSPLQNKPPYWRWNYPFRQAIMPMHHLIPDKIQYVNHFLNEHNFKYYSGYPSVIHAMVISAMDRNLPLAKPPAVITTGAENMLEYQKKDIQSYTGSFITDQYGFREGCGNASKCKSGIYHEDVEYGIIECINPVMNENGCLSGKIVCTGFSNFAFPFIRYEVGDYGIWYEKNTACDCGLHSRKLHRIEGRMDDYVITPEGRHIMRFDYIFKETYNVKEAQIIQKKQGEIIVKVVRRNGYSQRDEAYIRNEIKRWISPALSVIFEYSDEIERGSHGKFKAVLNLMDK